MSLVLDLKATVGQRPTRAQRERLFQAVGYVPSPEQAEVHFAVDEQGHPLRFRIVAGGEQAGKSKSAAMEAFSWSPWTELGWIVGPNFKQTRQEFTYIEQALEQIQALASVNKPERGEWSLTTRWGTLIETLSGINPEAIAGKAPDWILLVEAAQCPHEVFLRCMGRVGPKRGWLLVNGTFEGERGVWYRQLFKEWSTANRDGGRAFSLPTWSNRTLYPGGRRDPEILRLERLHGPDWFAERFAGIPSVPTGIVFRQFSYPTHVRLIERTPNPPDGLFINRQQIVLPEETEDQVWIDPGYAGGYAVLFVTIWNEVVVVYDEIYKQGWTTPEMVTAAMKHPRWRYVTELVMDVAGRQHQAQKSPYETWRELTGLTPRTRKVSILDGIERTRVQLQPHPETGLPGLFIGTACKMTAWELSEGYRYHVDNGIVAGEKPIDRNNHAAKALAYGLVHNFGLARRERRSSPTPPVERQASGWELLESYYG